MLLYASVLCREEYQLHASFPKFTTVQSSKKMMSNFAGNSTKEEVCKILSLPPKFKLTCVPDDDDEIRGDVVCADEGDLVVERVRDRKLPLEDVEEADWSDDLRLERAEVGGGLFKVGELEQELVHVARGLFQGDAIDQENHGGDGGLTWKR
jgi:hypothetical protein